MIEPTVKRVIGFVDGQNLFYAAKQAFGYSYPNFDAKRLTEVVATVQGWTPAGTRFYSGVPDPADNPFWSHFWSAKLAVMGTQGVVSYTRPLRYRNQTITLRDGSSTTVLVGQEKGVDVRIALDIVRLARSGDYDVALVFSQDQDLSEVADEIRSPASTGGGSRSRAHTQVARHPRTAAGSTARTGSASTVRRMTSRSIPGTTARRRRPRYRPHETSNAPPRTRIPLRHRPRRQPAGARVWRLSRSLGHCRRAGST